jgi:hypothetical protein
LDEASRNLEKGDPNVEGVGIPDNCQKLQGEMGIQKLTAEREEF